MNTSLTGSRNRGTTSAASRVSRSKTACDATPDRWTTTVLRFGFATQQGLGIVFGPATWQRNKSHENLLRSRRRDCLRYRRDDVEVAGRA